MASKNFSEFQHYMEHPTVSDCKQRMSHRSKRVHSQQWFGVLILAAVLISTVDSFGLVSKAKSTFRRTTLDSRVSEIAEALNGEIFFNKFNLNETEDLLVSQISPFSPPLTDDKFLTMQVGINENKKTWTKIRHGAHSVIFYRFFFFFQSKRVPVGIRYSAEAGLRPHYLTVAKKIKEAFPDVVLDKVILPKVSIGESDITVPTFEVMVDGKVIVPTLGRKERSLGNSICVYVSMQELEHAISRARRRRRPSTVYGDDANVRMELLKSKAAKHSKD